MSTPTATVLLNEGTCTAAECDARVEVLVSRNGGLAVTDAHGYSGMTDAGELICPDHFCQHCGDCHVTVEAYRRCRSGYDCRPAASAR